MTSEAMFELHAMRARIERLEAALREIMGMDEVAVVDFKKGDGWLHQRVASAALAAPSGALEEETP